jgi:hypothetical protein
MEVQRISLGVLFEQNSRYKHTYEGGYVGFTTRSTSEKRHVEILDLWLTLKDVGKMQFWFDTGLILHKAAPEFFKTVTLS